MAAERAKLNTQKLHNILICVLGTYDEIRETVTHVEKQVMYATFWFENLKERTRRKWKDNLKMYHSKRVVKT
jgi:hypothetical protein